MLFEVIHVSRLIGVPSPFKHIVEQIDNIRKGITTSNGNMSIEERKEEDV
jgi:hypothetical protein